MDGRRLQVNVSAPKRLKRVEAFALPCRGAFGTFLPLMSLEPARPAAWQDIERRFHGPLKIWEFLFLFALTISIIAAAIEQAILEQ